MKQENESELNNSLFPKPNLNRAKTNIGNIDIKRRTFFEKTPKSKRKSHYTSRR